MQNVFVLFKSSCPAVHYVIDTLTKGVAFLGSCTMMTIFTLILCCLQYKSIANFLNITSDIVVNQSEMFNCIKC